MDPETRIRIPESARCVETGVLLRRNRRWMPIRYRDNPFIHFSHCPRLLMAAAKAGLSKNVIAGDHLTELDGIVYFPSAGRATWRLIEFSNNDDLS